MTIAAIHASNIYGNDTHGVYPGLKNCGIMLGYNYGGAATGPPIGFAREERSE